MTRSPKAIAPKNRAVEMQASSSRSGVWSNEAWS